MVSWILCVGLVLLHVSSSVEAKLHYAVIFPAEIRSHETVCIQLEGAEGKSRVQITLKQDEKSTTLVEKNFDQHSVFTCVPIQVHSPSHSGSDLGVPSLFLELGSDDLTKVSSQDLRSSGSDGVKTLEVSIENAGETIVNSTKVLVMKKRSSVLVQTDKAVYKPGQTVKFRILSINEDLKPKNTVLPVVELQDPEQNRIGQWLNVNLNQGMAEFSLPLSAEPPLGEYSIRVDSKVHTFTVEEYVLPKFEVSLQFPKVVMFDSKQFPLRVCGRYTYGKPVQGSYAVTLCQKSYKVWWGRRDDEYDICTNFTGKLDKLGCQLIEVNSEIFRLKSSRMEQELSASATITESGTGIELSTTSTTSISNTINKVSFVNPDNNYKAGIPFTGVIKVVDASDDPIPGINVYLTSSDPVLNDILVTDDNGEASFTLNTNDWRGKKTIRARTNLESPSFGSRKRSPLYGNAQVYIKPFYSRTKSFLKLHSLNQVLPCQGQQEVEVEYIIKHTELTTETDHVDLHYLVTSKGSIQDSGSLEISIKNKNEDQYGKITLKLPLSAGISSTLQALVYAMLPNGNVLADSANYKAQRCFKNKVSMGFLPNEVLPGSEVSLQVQAASGSLCGLRVVDKSVVLMKPEKELTIDTVFELFPSWQSGKYDNRIQDDDDECKHVSGRRRSYLRLREKDVDVHSLFEGINLKVITSAEIKKPMDCNKDFPTMRFHGTVYRGFDRGGRKRVHGFMDSDDLLVGSAESTEEELEKQIIRTYFPETWIWELIGVGDSGSVDLHHKAPDTITDWNAGAICLGENGIGLSSPASLRVFQPFFVDLALPYSVVRGETFILKGSVFNYLKQCIKIEVNLGPTEELQRTPCTDCSYSSCLCADESKTFYWNLKATKLGEVNITVQTKAVKTEELCQNEIPIVPQQGATDTIVKPLLVQPGGVLVEKSHSSLLCIQDGEDNTKTDEVSLKVPKNILKDSERAHVAVLGDIMGTALQNLDSLLKMPYGCGEQNMVLFAPNIYILQYLEKTHQLTDEIKSKATKFLESGYQRQLTYKRNDGSYSAFGKSDPEGNTWLTAFVVKSFSKARPYIFIDESHLEHSFSWLKKNRNENGCFRSVGRLFNNAMKGGVEDDISLSAYVTIALIDGGVSLEDPLIRDAVSCLQKASKNVTNVYTLALLAYTFTLCREKEFRKTILDKLEEKAVRGDGQLHLKRDIAPPKQESYWCRAPSAEVEMSAYLLLALLSGPEADLGKSTEIVKWMSKQQNPYGGFSSTQDTVVALQALAKYSELTFSDKGDITVTVTSSSGFMQEFHVDKNNRLLLQRATLPTVVGDYTVTATGKGCVVVQTVLRYNVPPPRSDTSFSLTVTPKSAKECLGDTITNFDILISAAYTGTREKSNMAVIEVKMLSGYIPIKSTVKKLEKDKLIQRSEIQMDAVTFYLNQVGHNPVNLSFMVEQNIEVKNLKPATAKVYDYYETDEQAVAEYNHPCNTVDKFTNSR